jgi:hypothetical protein
MNICFALSITFLFPGLHTKIHAIPILTVAMNHSIITIPTSPPALIGSPENRALSSTQGATCYLCQAENSHSSLPCSEDLRGRTAELPYNSQSAVPEPSQHTCADSASTHVIAPQPPPRRCRQRLERQVTAKHTACAREVPETLRLATTSSSSASSTSSSSSMSSITRSSSILDGTAAASQLSARSESTESSSCGGCTHASDPLIRTSQGAEHLTMTQALRGTEEDRSFGLQHRGESSVHVTRPSLSSKPIGGVWSPQGSHCGMAAPRTRHDSDDDPKHVETFTLTLTQDCASTSGTFSVPLVQPDAPQHEFGHNVKHTVFSDTIPSGSCICGGTQSTPARHGMLHTRATTFTPKSSGASLSPPRMVPVYTWSRSTRGGVRVVADANQRQDWHDDNTAALHAHQASAMQPASTVPASLCASSSTSPPRTVPVVLPHVPVGTCWSSARSPKRQGPATDTISQPRTTEAAALASNVGCGTCVCQVLQAALDTARASAAVQGMDFRFVMDACESRVHQLMKAPKEDLGFSFPPKSAALPDRGAWC